MAGGGGGGGGLGFFGGGGWGVCFPGWGNPGAGPPTPFRGRGGEKKVVGPGDTASTKQRKDDSAGGKAGANLGSPFGGGGA